MFSLRLLNEQCIHVDYDFSKEFLDFDNQDVNGRLMSNYFNKFPSAKPPQAASCLENPAKLLAHR